VQHGYQLVSMTAALFKKLIVQFGKDLVHFVHLSETISVRSRPRYSPFLAEALYGSFWSMCEHQ
jgi:hypothetical protein